MLLISQNLMNYEMEFPDDVVLRINMAWVDNIKKFKETLDRYDLDFFIDFPSGRIKPPNNRYTIDQLVPIIKAYKNIKFLAISNVETPEEIDKYSAYFDNRPQIVPKIETIKGVKNIANICSSLSTGDYLMLDHDDLFTNVIKNNLDTEAFIKLVDNLVSFCDSSKLNLLRTRGVIFSEKI